MRRNKAKYIGKLLKDYLRRESLDSPLNEQRLLSAWPQVISEAMEAYTTNL